MKSHNKRRSGLLFEKVLKKEPIQIQPRRVIEPEKVDNTIAENIARNIAKHDRQNAMIEAERMRDLNKQFMERESFNNLPKYKELKPMDPKVERSWSPEEVVYERKIPTFEQLPVFEPPVFKPLRGREKRQFKRENIQRIADKYDITRGQARRGWRKMRKAGEDYIPEEYLSSLNMIKRNSATPFKLPHQSNTALKQNERELSQQQKDSLSDQANKFGKPFFSPEFGVNVDPEDGVLSNRPTFMPDLDDFEKLPVEKRGGYTPEQLESLYPKSEGRKLTYDIEDKPIEDLVRDAYAKRRDEYMSMVGKQKHPMLPAQTEDEAMKEFFAESYSTRFNPETREIEDLVSSSGDGAISEEELAKVPSYLRNPFKQ